MLNGYKNVLQTKNCKVRYKCNMCCRIIFLCIYNSNICGFIFQCFVVLGTETFEILPEILTFKKKKRSRSTGFSVQVFCSVCRTRRTLYMGHNIDLNAEMWVSSGQRTLFDLCFVFTWFVANCEKDICDFLSVIAFF